MTLKSLLTLALSLEVWVDEKGELFRTLQDVSCVYPESRTDLTRL